MLAPGIESRAFFNERVAKYCDGDRAKAESVPLEALLKSVKDIATPEEAERYISGMMHWLRSKKPRTLEQALVIARSNITYCFHEGFPKKKIEMWTKILDDGQLPKSPAPTPEEAFKAGTKIGEAIKAGKDVGEVASLARKVLAKKASLLPGSGS